MNDAPTPPILLTGEVLGPKHPTVLWVRREVVPKLVEELSAEEIVVFDPPDRPAAAGHHPPGLLVVARAFEGVPMAERVARVRFVLRDASPVRPLCLTPRERLLAPQAPGPVLGALKHGVRVH